MVGNSIVTCSNSSCLLPRPSSAVRPVKDSPWAGPAMAGPLFWPKMVSAGPQFSIIRPKTCLPFHAVAQLIDIKRAPQ